MTTTHNIVEQRLREELATLHSAGNLRRIPADTQLSDNLIDFTSNDYLGIAENLELQQEFLKTIDFRQQQFTSSASRLLACKQTAYSQLETLLEKLYSRPALLFNSGYHANTGIISAITDSHTLILADKLIHASIIDGAHLSKGRFMRFSHNNYEHLRRLIKANRNDFATILIVIESIYSMDGDAADINELIAIKREYDNVILYVDEAHAIGCEGPGGLGLTQASIAPQEVDIIVGTLGKALASQGAFAVCNPLIKDYLINRARSFIFSTSIPPISVLWSQWTLKRALEMDSERAHLRQISHLVASHNNNIITDPRLASKSTSAIQPFIIGDSALTIKMSQQLSAEGFKVLPIRTPTVPPGTERLRISLCANRTTEEINNLLSAIDSAASELDLNTRV